MIVLAIRTDKPEAELYLYEANKKLAELKWQAHRELSDTIHIKLKEILNKSSISYKDIEGIVIYKGPGSFTGLRIGASVGNALAYSLAVPIVASTGQNWVEDGIKALQKGQNDKIAIPKYGAPARTTKPRK